MEQKSKTAIYRLLIAEGKTEEEALKIEQERLAKMKSITSMFADFAKHAPLLHEDALQCLSCGRLVLIGKCCASPTYCKDEDRFKGYNVEKTDIENIFSVKMGNTIYFIIEEKPSVYGLSLYRSIDSAEKSLKKN